MPPNSAGAHDSESLSTSEVHVSAPGDVLDKAAGTGALVGTGAGEAAGKGAPGVDGPEGTIPHPTDSSSRPNSATDVEAEIEAQIEAGELPACVVHQYLSVLYIVICKKD